MTVTVSGESAALRLMRQANNERRRIKEPMPTQNQVAMVLHALADHTAIMSALQHRPDPTSPWPEATSIGRWLHDVGNDMEDIEKRSTTLSDSAVIAPMLVESLFNIEGVTPGVAELNFDFTTSKNGKRDKYHVIVYQESSGWHEPIQAALKED